MYQEVLSGQRMGYIRTGGHPDHRELESAIAKMEQAAAMRIRSDGMGAIGMALAAAAMTRGPKLIIVLPCYGDTPRAASLLTRLSGGLIKVLYVFANDPLFLERLADAIFIPPQTGAILLEGLTNPTLDMVDFVGVMNIVQNHPRGKPLTIYDNTFLTGLFRPLEWGADVVVNSGTKYIIGESAWTLGYCGVSNDLIEQHPDFWEVANDWAGCFGGTLAPFEAWVTNMLSLRDLEYRMKKHSARALAIARFLEEHPCVERVVYPGLESYPHYHDRALFYLGLLDDGERYFGGMIAFYLKDANLTKTQEFLYFLTQHTHIWNKASLGAPDDIVENPTRISHKKMSPELRQRCGITDNLVRFSAGRGRTTSVEQAKEELDYGLRTVLGRRC